jgi:AcrR family transcriptional regulator
MKRTKEEAQRTKEKILKCSLRLFVEKGYEKTTLDQITRKVGYTKGAVYWHFKNKESILDEIIDHFDQKAINFIPVLLALNISPLMKAKFLIYAHVPNFKSEKMISNFFRLKAQASEIYRKRGKQPYAMAFINTLPNLLREAKKEGEVRMDTDSNISTITIMSILTGTYIKYATNKKFFEKIHKISDIMDDYLERISTKKGIDSTKGHNAKCIKLLPDYYDF